MVGHDDSACRTRSDRQERCADLYTRDSSARCAEFAVLDELPTVISVTKHMLAAEKNDLSRRKAARNIYLTFHRRTVIVKLS